MGNSEHPAAKKDARWMSTGYVSATNLEGIPAADSDDLARHLHMDLRQASEGNQDGRTNSIS